MTSHDLECPSLIAGIKSDQSTTLSLMSSSKAQAFFNHYVVLSTTHVELLSEEMLTDPEIAEYSCEPQGITGFSWTLQTHNVGIEELYQYTNGPSTLPSTPQQACILHFVSKM